MSTEETSTAKSRRFDGKKYGLFKDARAFIVLIILIFIIFRLIIGFSRVSGDSMNPTLKNGEFVLYTRYTRNYEIGDIVSVRIPSGEYYVKRIVGLPGDEIIVANGNLYINGELEEEDYAYGETIEENGNVSYPYVVPEDHVFVVGDNREVSTDSRSFGAVGIKQIRGKIRFVGGAFYVRSPY